MGRKQDAAVRVHLSVLGATGFVGGALLRRIDARPPGELSVTALVRGQASRVGRDRVQVVTGALGSTLPRELFPERPYVVVHLATKQRDTDGTGFDVNRNHAAHLLEQLTPQCRGIVFGSSASVYGQGAQHHVDENVLEAPETALAQSRLDVERVLRQGAAARGISSVALRPRFVIGRGDRYFLPGIARLSKSRIGIGDGRQSFTIIDVDDYAEIILRLARRIAAAAEARHEVFNVGYFDPIRFDELGALVGLSPRLRIPVSARALATFRRHGGRRVQALSTQLELVGLTHQLDVSALERVVGRELLARNPYGAIRAAMASD